jgi:PAS domain S-box-containing protein
VAHLGSLTFIVVLIIGAGAVLVMVMQRRVRDELNLYMQARARHLVESVGAAFRVTGGNQALQRAVAVLGAEREVQAIVVVRGSSRQIIAATRPELIGRSVEEALPSHLSTLANLWQDMERGQTFWQISDDRGRLVSPLVVAMPLDVATSQTWGDARIAVEIDGRGQKARLYEQMARDLVRITFLFALVAAGLVWASGRILGRGRGADGEGHSTLLPESERTLLVTSVAAAVAVKKAIDEATTGMAVMELMPGGGRIVHANPGFIAQCGHSDAHHATGGWILPLNDDVVATLRSGRMAHSALRYRADDGSWFDGELHLDPVRSADGPVLQAVGMIIDGSGERIQRRRQADENRRLRAIIERLPVAVLIHDGTVAQFANPAAERLFRVDTSVKPLAWTTEDRMQPQEWERAMNMWRATVQEGTINRDHFLLRRDDGSDFMADVVAEAITWGEGRSIMLTILDHDSLLVGMIGREDPFSEFYRLFNEIPNPTWRSTATGSGAFFNRAWQALTGRSEMEAVGDAWQSAIHPEDREYYLSSRAHAHQVRTPFNGIYRLRRFDGNWAWIAEHGTPCYEDGAFSGYLFSCYDITDLKSAEQAIRGAHAESELLLSTIGSAIIGIDTNDRVMRCNAAAERIFGVTSSEIVGRTLAETGIRLDWADIFIAINDCTTRGSVVELHDLRYQRPDGSDGFLDIAINASQGAWGDGSERLGVVLLATDVTERKVSESQRNQGVKLEAIGQLAAGIAHEINTPIQFVGDNLRFLRDAHRDLDALQKTMWPMIDHARPNAPADLIAAVDDAVRIADPEFMSEEIPKAIEQSLEGVERVATIVKAMKEFSHPEQGGKKPADINKLVITTLTVSRNEYKYVADMELNLAEDLPMVPCVASEISQVVLNLVVNAAHAIADVNKGTELRGRITISTCKEDRDVLITIADTGGGIPERIRSRIFDPFFTTKEVGRGTGQGLYIARTVVVKKHGGTIDFTSETGKGTTFVVRLPLSEGGAS